jgi:hypothetical protein
MERTQGTVAVLGTGCAVPVVVVPLPPLRGGRGGCVDAPGRSRRLAALGVEPFGLTLIAVD